MTMDLVKSLIVETLTDPAKAARRVLAIDVPAQAIWMGIALIAVLNGFYYALLLPQMAQAGMVAQSVAGSPLLVTGFILLVFSVMVVLTSVCGRFLGGHADVVTIGKITVWMQGLRFAAQVLISLVSLVLPPLGWLASLALGIWGIWIILNFVAEAHGFTVPKALGTLAMTFIGMVLIMSVFSAAFGLTPAVPNGGI